MLKSVEEGEAVTLKETGNYAKVPICGLAFYVHVDQLNRYSQSQS